MSRELDGATAERISLALDVALQRAGTTEGCQQLYSLLSDDLALMYVISVAHHALKAMASRVALGRMAHGKKWYTMGLFMVKDELCYKDARLHATPPISYTEPTCVEFLPQEVTAPWACEEWVIVGWLQRALAGAMCGAPLSKGTSKEESTPGTWIAETLMALSRDMLDLIFTWWSREAQSQEHLEFPIHLIDSAEVSLQCIHISFPYAALLLEEPGLTVLPLALATLQQHTPVIFREHQKATKLWLSQAQAGVGPADTSMPMPQPGGAAEGSSCQGSSNSTQTRPQLPQPASSTGEGQLEQTSEHQRHPQQHSKKGKKGKRGRGQGKASSKAGPAGQQEPGLGSDQQTVYDASFVRANNLQVLLYLSFASLRRMWTGCNELVGLLGSESIHLLVNCATDLLAGGLSCNCINKPGAPSAQPLEQESNSRVSSETFGAQKSGAGSRHQASVSTAEGPSDNSAVSNTTTGSSTSSSTTSGKNTQGPGNLSTPACLVSYEFDQCIQERSNLVLAAVEGIRCSLWNTYSSGGPFMQTCAPSHVLASIRCIYTLTHVARNMLQEATSPDFLKALSARSPEQGVVRSWCSTCSGLCEGATIPLQRTTMLLEQSSGSDVEEHVKQQVKHRELFGPDRKQKRHLGSDTGGQPQSAAPTDAKRKPIALHPDTVTLLPVLVAAALQLSHAALAVVRVTSVVVVPQLPKVPILAESADAVSVAKAGQAALTLYHEILSSAVLMDKDHKDIALASADDPLPKTHQSAQAPAHEGTTAADASTSVGVTVTSGVHRDTASTGSGNASSGSTGAQTEAATERSCSPARSPDSVDLMRLQLGGDRSGAASAATTEQGEPASYGGDGLQRAYTAARASQETVQTQAAAGTVAAPQPSLPPTPPEQVSAQVSDAHVAVPACAPSLPTAAAAVTVAAVATAVAAARAQRRGFRAGVHPTVTLPQQKVKGLFGLPPRPLSSISRSEMLPPDVCRHALAIASWSCNLPCIIQWLHPALSLYSMYADMGCKAMTSWESICCSQMGTALIRNLSMLAATASALMAITNGDLPGWLGSLAPSGALTPTQLFYRIAGVYTSVSSLQVSSGHKAYLEDVIGVHTELMPLLSLAWQLPRREQHVPQQGYVPLSPTSDAQFEVLQPGALLTAEGLAAAFGSSLVTLKSVRTAGDADLFTHTALRRTEHALDGAGIPAVYGTFEGTDYMYICLDSSDLPKAHHAVMKAVKPKEPLYKLMLKDRKIWSSVWKVQAEEEGEAEHRQLLEAYVVAVADKAAAQLPPELAQGLQKVFE